MLPFCAWLTHSSLYTRPAHMSAAQSSFCSHPTSACILPINTPPVSASDLSASALSPRVSFPEDSLVFIHKTVSGLGPPDLLAPDHIKGRLTTVHYFNQRCPEGSVVCLTQGYRELWPSAWDLSRASLSLEKSMLAHQGWLDLSSGQLPTEYQITIQPASPSWGWEYCKWAWRGEIPR